MLIICKDNCKWKCKWKTAEHKSAVFFPSFSFFSFVLFCFESMGVDKWLEGKTPVCFNGYLEWFKKNFFSEISKSSTMVTFYSE